MMHDSHKKAQGRDPVFDSLYICCRQAVDSEPMLCKAVLGVTF